MTIFLEKWVSLVDLLSLRQVERREGLEEVSLESISGVGSELRKVESGERIKGVTLNAGSRVGVAEIKVAVHL